MDKLTYINHLRKLQSIINNRLLAVEQPTKDVSEKETEKIITNNDIKSSKDNELNEIHNKLHSIWNMYKKGKRIGKYNRAVLINLHIYTVKELFKRKMKHIWLNDLDDTLPLDLKKATEGSREYDKLKGKSK